MRHAQGTWEAVRCDAVTLYVHASVHAPAKRAHPGRRRAAGRAALGRGPTLPRGCDGTAHRSGPPGSGEPHMQKPRAREFPTGQLASRVQPRDACPSALVRYVQVTRSPSPATSRAFLRGLLVGSAPDTSPHRPRDDSALDMHVPRGLLRLASPLPKEDRSDCLRTHRRWEHQLLPVTAWRRGGAASIFPETPP